MAINFDKEYPWCDMRVETIDGYDMVWIPKFYVKSGVDSSGNDYYIVSKSPLSGYRCHSAFITPQGEVKGVYITAGHVMIGAGKLKPVAPTSNTGGMQWGAILTAFGNTLDPNHKNKWTQNDYKPLSFTSDGWHIMNWYELGVLRLLTMIEYGTPDLIKARNQTKQYEGGNMNEQASLSKWRGFRNLWWGAKTWVDGIYNYQNGVTKKYDLKLSNPSTGAKTSIYRDLSSGSITCFTTKWKHDEGNPHVDDAFFCTGMASSVDNDRTKGSYKQCLVYNTTAQKIPMKHGDKILQGTNSTEWSNLMLTMMTNDYGAFRLGKYVF